MVAGGAGLGRAGREGWPEGLLGRRVLHQVWAPDPGLDPGCICCPLPLPHLSPASCCCSFLCTEAPQLDLEPPVELAPADRARLHKYAAAMAVRWAACTAATSTSSGSAS